MGNPFLIHIFILPITVLFYAFLLLVYTIAKRHEEGRGSTILMSFCTAPIVYIILNMGLLLLVLPLVQLFVPSDPALAQSEETMGDWREVLFGVLSLIASAASAPASIALGGFLSRKYFVNTSRQLTRQPPQRSATRQTR